MELNWTTFLLEIFNFLVLVWILKRFLYQPILDIIARRREAIEEKLARSEQLQAEAGQLKERYENRLDDWEHERQKAMETLMQELEENRHHQLENLKLELEQEKEKSLVSRARQERQQTQEIEQRALQQSAEFASRLLSEAAGPELENRLFDLLLNGLMALTDEQIKLLNNNWTEQPVSITVASAYPLTEDQQHRLEVSLNKVTGLSVPLNYEQDEKLLAGLDIMIGDWALQLNVRDELRGFMEFAHIER